MTKANKPKIEVCNGHIVKVASDTARQLDLWITCWDDRDMVHAKMKFKSEAERRKAMGQLLQVVDAVEFADLGKKFPVRVLIRETGRDRFPGYLAPQFAIVRGDAEALAVGNIIPSQWFNIEAHAGGTEDWIKVLADYDAKATVKNTEIEAIDIEIKLADGQSVKASFEGDSFADSAEALLGMLKLTDRYGSTRPALVRVRGKGGDIQIGTPFGEHERSGWGSLKDYLSE
jgi:hypothetical protein